MIDRDVKFEARGGLGAITGGFEASSCRSDCQQHQGRDLMAAIRGYVGPELGVVEEAIESSVTSKFKSVCDLGRQASAMGGKRLRPTLVILAARACGDDHVPRSLGPISDTEAVSRTSFVRDSANTRQDLVAIAAAIELVHAASLVHDDVMDSAIERRHLPTIAHQSGTSSAILLGDFLFTKAYALAASCRGTMPARRIAAAATELCEGELRQQLSAGNLTLTISEYRSILLQKTGSLCGVACRLGSWRVGGTRRQQRALHRYGVMLGLAFQIFDDWLDYWGTAAVGKTLGTDLAQQKPTLPLLRLISCAPAKLRQEVLQRVSEQSKSTFAWTREQLDRYEAGPYTLQVAQRCVNKAKAALQTLPNSPAKNYLEAIADYSVHRRT